MRGDQRVELLAKRGFLRAFAIVPWSALQRHMQQIIGNKMRPRAGSEQSSIGLICAAGPQGLRGWDAGCI